MTDFDFGLPAYTLLYWTYMWSGEVGFSVN